MTTIREGVALIYSYFRPHRRLILTYVLLLFLLSILDVFRVSLIYPIANFGMGTEGAGAQASSPHNQSEPQYTHHPLPTDDPTRRKPDITKAKEILGWEPSVAFADGLEPTIAYFQSQLRE